MEMIKENATTREETESSKALKGHMLRGAEGTAYCSLNSWNEDGRGIFPLENFVMVGL